MQSSTYCNPELHCNSFIANKKARNRKELWLWYSSVHRRSVGDNTLNPILNFLIQLLQLLNVFV